MDAVGELLNGFATAFTPANLLWALLGVTLGTAVGVLPGIGPALTVALLLPVTFRLDPTSAFIMFAGIYYGGMYGGSTTSILLNTPGESASIITALEGNRMARRGRGAAALATAAIGSFVAGTLGTLALSFVAPGMVELALKFGPADYFALMVLAFTTVSAVLGSSAIRGLASLGLGLAIGLVGIDTQTGQARFTLGVPQLLDGIDVVIVVVGLFAVGETLHVASRMRHDTGEINPVSGGLWLRRADWARSWKPWLRGTALGFPLGALPAGGAEIPTFLSYATEKRLTKHPEEFGKGAIEGVAGPEAANNAAAAGTLVPLLTLGLPTSATAAIMLAAFQQYGLQPGPLLFERNATLVWALIASLYIGNTILLLLNLPLAGIWVRLLSIPRPYLYAGILVFATLGTYSVNNSVVDLVVLYVVGLLGFAMRRVGMPLAPAVIGLILGPVAQEQARPGPAEPVPPRSDRPTAPSRRVLPSPPPRHETKAQTTRGVAPRPQPREPGRAGLGEGLVLCWRDHSFEVPMLIHMIGVCGTGMGSLAGLLADAGHRVRGSDENVYPPVSTLLRARGIPILEGYRAEHITSAGEAGGRPDLVIVGNIANRHNPEVTALLQSGIEYLSMPQAIGRFFLSARHPVVVTGTHGKTTTTAVIARMLLETRRDPSFLVGGVLKDLDTSYRLGPEGADHAFVIEGDEYETSFFDKGPKFLHYRPRTAVLTSVEYDHAEMFPTLEAVKEAFRSLVALVPAESEGGTLIVCADDPLAWELAGACRGRVIPYGLGDDAQVRGQMLEAGPQGMSFRVTVGGEELGTFSTRQTGNHNLRNALSAVAVGRVLGLSAAEIGAGLAAFQGVRRRQEVRGVAAGVTVLDDFAHHPTAVRETIAAVRARFPGQRVWAVFEPRTNTTRRDVFQQEYARSFDAADEVIVAPVDHPERAPEGRRFSVDRLIADLKGRGLRAAALPGVDAIVSHIGEKARRGDVLLVMSNGGFGGIHDRLLEALQLRAAAGESSGR